MLYGNIQMVPIGKKPEQTHIVIQKFAGESGFEGLLTDDWKERHVH